jgi:hypothetical protein
LSNFSSILWKERQAVSNILQGIKQTLTDKSDRLNIYNMKHTRTRTRTHSHTRTHTICTYRRHSLWTTKWVPVQSPFRTFSATKKLHLLWVFFFSTLRKSEGDNEDIFICFVCENSYISLFSKQWDSACTTCKRCVFVWFLFSDSIILTDTFRKTKSFRHLNRHL